MKRRAIDREGKERRVYPKTRRKDKVVLYLT